MLDFRAKNDTKNPVSDFSGRRKFLIIFMMGCMVTLIGRAVDLQVLNKKFLQEKGDMYLVDDEPVSAYRGMITDRSGAPLAISTPVESISVNPRELKIDDKNQLKHLEKQLTATHPDVPLTDAQKAGVIEDYKKQKLLKISQMEHLLNLPKGKVLDILHDDSHKKFAYIAHQIHPALSEQVKALKLVGVYFDREFQRFYPTSGVAAHLVGFTNLDDVGQEGMEAGYEDTLKGTAGSKRVMRDGLRHIIEDVESINEPVSGKNIELSIDQRIQSLAYRELQAAVNENHAKSGTVVVLDAKNGEVLAAVNQPTFNPHVRASLKENLYRNRAFTDIFEPGSTIKPFVAAAALEGGYVTPNTVFNTNGSFLIGKHVVKDVHNYGSLDLMHVLKKSSNIGVTMMALKMPPKYFWGVYKSLGIGSSAETGFKGEAKGRMLDYKEWQDFDRAVMSFGYGMNVSAIQLARAYTALADDGILHSISLIKRDEDDKPRRVFSANTAKTIRSMLENVIMKDGTAYEARVDGYTVAGKTGTVKKANESHGYGSSTYFSVFAGMAPARNPRLIIVVMIDEPSAGKYYGGLVAAPVFSKVMTGALRLLNVAPDQETTMPILLTRHAQ
ncbi:MAG: penicillin-binding protein 2 [Methylococcales bacterium]|nr:penicillin-binding protein 2 [Methylococcales bacterium]